MRHWSGFAAFALLLIVGLFTLACGSTRTLKSVTVSPAIATQSSPSGVQFSATGVFSGTSTPQPLTSKDITWCAGVLVSGGGGACAGNINPGATVDQNGVAQCLSGFSGTVTILAGKLESGMVIVDGPRPMSVFGSAQLTCP
ncbi:MAG TPA: hypothetical protein VFO39_08045 [Candidatus Sulfotelmatobacter sp.]|nr:hypothetical protein [Candidatus Sulfotelmatobacter sp.]